MEKEGEAMLDKDYLPGLLKNSDKGEFLEYLTEHLEEIEKGILFVGIPDGKGGLLLRVKEIGFQYGYEMQGFIDMVVGNFTTDEDDEAST